MARICIIARFIQGIVKFGAVHFYDTGHRLGRSKLISI